MSIRTGFVTQVGMELDEAIQQAGALDLDFLEIMMDGATRREALSERADDILAMADDADIALLVHLPFSLDIGSPHEHVRHGSLEELRTCIETAAGIGVEKAVLHASSEAWSGPWSREEIQDRILEGIREIDGSAVDHGIEVCVENIPGGFFATQDFHRVFDETDASVTLDTGHARIDGLDAADMAAMLREHGERVSHVHLNDTRDGVGTDEHLPFGAGDIDFDTLFEPLRDGWTGTLSLEVFTTNRDYIAMSKEQLDALL